MRFACLFLLLLSTQVLSNNWVLSEYSDKILYKDNLDSFEIVWNEQEAQFEALISYHDLRRSPAFFSCAPRDGNVIANFTTFVGAAQTIEPTLPDFIVPLLKLLQKIKDRKNTYFDSGMLEL